MEDSLFMEEEQELQQIKTANQKKGMDDLNRKSLSPDDLDEIFCDDFRVIVFQA